MRFSFFGKKSSAAVQPLGSTKVVDNFIEYIEKSLEIYTEMYKRYKKKIRELTDNLRGHLTDHNTLRDYDKYPLATKLLEEANNIFVDLDTDDKLKDMCTNIETKISDLNDDKINDKYKYKFKSLYDKDFIRIRTRFLRTIEYKHYVTDKGLDLKDNNNDELKKGYGIMMISNSPLSFFDNEIIVKLEHLLEDLRGLKGSSGGYRAKGTTRYNKKRKNKRSTRKSRF